MIYILVTEMLKVMESDGSIVIAEKKEINGKCVGQLIATDISDVTFAYCPNIF